MARIKAELYQKLGLNLPAKAKAAEPANESPTKKKRGEAPEED